MKNVKVFFSYFAVIVTILLACVSLYAVFSNSPVPRMLALLVAGLAAFYYLVLIARSDKIRLFRVVQILQICMPIVIPVLLRLVSLNKILGLDLDLSTNYMIFLTVGAIMSLVVTHYHLGKKYSEVVLNDKKVIIITCMISAAVYFMLTTIAQHRFLTFAFDLGIFDQTAWLYSRGLAPLNSITKVNDFADHFEPIMYVVGLTYRLFNSVTTLLAIEAILVSLGFVPIYLIAKHYLKSSFSALLLGIVYLASLGTLNAINYPVHPGTWLPTFYGFAIWFAIQRKTALYFLFILLAISCKESAAVHLLLLSPFIFFGLKRRAYGLATMVISVLGYFFIFKYVFPLASGGLSYAHGIFSNISNNPVDLAKFILLHPYQALLVIFGQPIKVQMIYLTLGIGGFLSLAGLPAILLLIPFLPERLLTDHPGMISMNFHYSIPIMMAVVIGSIFSIDRLGHGRPKKISYMSYYVFLCAIIMMLTVPNYRSPLYNLVNPKFYRPDPSQLQIQRTLKMIPGEASVIAQDPFVPHLSHRQYIGLIGSSNIENFDYVLLAKSSRFSSWPIDQGQITQEIVTLRGAEGYRIAEENDAVVLFEKVK